MISCMIVAVAAGVVDGMKMGDNTKALLLTRSLSEMGRLGTAMGADVVTFAGMAGIGDLLATCASPLSRNHQVGERLARGQTLQEIQASMLMVAEGVKTTRAVHQLLYEGAAVGEALESLMSRVVGHEFPPQLVVASAGEH